MGVGGRNGRDGCPSRPRTPRRCVPTQSAQSVVSVHSRSFAFIRGCLSTLRLRASAGEEMVFFVLRSSFFVLGSRKSPQKSVPLSAGQAQRRKGRNRRLTNNEQQNVEGMRRSEPLTLRHSDLIIRQSAVRELHPFRVRGIFLGFSFSRGFTPGYGVAPRWGVVSLRKPLRSWRLGEKRKGFFVLGSWFLVLGFRIQNSAFSIQHSAFSIDSCLLTPEFCLLSPDS